MLQRLASNDVMSCDSRCYVLQVASARLWKGCELFDVALSELCIISRTVSKISPPHFGDKMLKQENNGMLTGSPAYTTMPATEVVFLTIHPLRRRLLRFTPARRRPGCTLCVYTSGCTLCVCTHTHTRRKR